jgi:hypothetical protein
VALALDEHAKLLELMEAANRECVDVKVVPDLLQFIALRARLEDLDGLPVINVNDVPLQGINAWVKRALDIALSAAALVVLAIPMAVITLLVRWTSHGAVVLPAGAHGARRPRVHRLSRSARWYRTRRTPRAGVGARRRSAHDAGGPLAAPLRPRRAAAVLERAQGRHVDCGAASGAAVLRRAVQAPHPAVHAPPQGQGRHHRLGAGERVARQHRRSKSASSTTSTTSRTGR